MFDSNSVSILGKMAGLRERMRLIGAPSEQILYARRRHPVTQYTAKPMPLSARNTRRSNAQLEHDTTVLIRHRVCPASRP